MFWFIGIVTTMVFVAWGVSRVVTRQCAVLLVQHHERLRALEKTLERVDYSLNAIADQLHLLAMRSATLRPWSTWSKTCERSGPSPTGNISVLQDDVASLRRLPKH